MYSRVDRAQRAVSVTLGIITLAGVLLLFACDVYPAMFPVRAHDVLGAFPLAMIAFAYLLYQSAHRPPPKEWLKATLLAIAFLCWAANQVWRNPQQATILNDVAIALFVLDVFLVMIGWPAASPDESFAETYAKVNSQPTRSDAVR